MSKYNNMALSANKRLQSATGLKGGFVDGYFGNSSQEALIASGKHIGFDWQKLRQHFGSFNQAQVDGFNIILSAINEHGGEAMRPTYVAYIMSTIWHETAHTMQPISEIGKGRSRRYGKWFKNSKGAEYGHANYNGTAYLKTDYPHLYYGRGYVQLTWLDNYKKLGDLLGVDLAGNPDLAMRPDISAAIMIKGMLGGLFTGLSLSRLITYGLYFEFVNARRIINSTDKDKMLAEYAVKFLDSLTLESAALIDEGTKVTC